LELIWPYDGLPVSKRSADREFPLLPLKVSNATPRDYLFNSRGFENERAILCRTGQSASINFDTTSGEIQLYVRQDKAPTRDFLIRQHLALRGPAWRIRFEPARTGLGAVTLQSPLPLPVAGELIVTARSGDRILQPWKRQVVLPGLESLRVPVEGFRDIGEVRWVWATFSRGNGRNWEEWQRSISFEPQAGSLPVHADGDASVLVRHELGVTEAPELKDAPESQAFRLHYSFDAGWKFLRVGTHRVTIESIRSEIPVDERRGRTFFEPREYGLWLHGDGKGCQARIRLIDATGQTFQPDGPKIDWTGWRYVTFPMQSTDEKPLARWDGANDGVIHYPIKWDTIFLLDNVSREPVEGEIYLSAPTLIY